MITRRNALAVIPAPAVVALPAMAEPKDPVVSLCRELEALHDYLDNTLFLEEHRIFESIKNKHKKVHWKVGVYRSEDGEETDVYFYTLEQVLAEIERRRHWRTTLYGPGVSKEEWHKRLDALEAEWREKYKVAYCHNKALEDDSGYTAILKQISERCTDLRNLENKIMSTPATSIEGALKQARLVKQQGTEHEFEPEWLDGLIEGLTRLS